MLCLGNSDLAGALSEVPKVCSAWELGNAAESSESWKIVSYNIAYDYLRLMIGIKACCLVQHSSQIEDGVLWIA